MPANRFYVVDQLTGAQAILVADDETTVTIPANALPKGAKEGTVLRVPIGDDGQAVWSAARVDDAETARRRAEAADRLKRLKKRDPGGDIRL